VASPRYKFINEFADLVVVTNAICRRERGEAVTEGLPYKLSGTTP
jgi:hypothetical protein